MQPSGTPTLTGYSSEDFPSRTTQSCLLLRKEEIRSNICATAWVAQDLLKAQAILSDTTDRRSAVDWENLKRYWKSEKATIL